MKISEKKEEKRSRILDAAAAVFSKEGYHQAKVEDIARIAGIGKGTIYLYFKNKRHLYYCMIKEIYDIFLESIYTQIECENDLKKALKTITEYTFDFLDSHKEKANLLINRPGTVDEDIQAWLFAQKQKIVDFLAQIIKKYADSNNCDRDFDSTLVAHCFLGALAALMAERLFGYNKIDSAKLTDKMLDIFFHGIHNSSVQV
ncbi:MAG: TetR/AcrR family transcriptional regulator [Tepidanaerobacter acetatoxydans]|uniref:TetR/AcrR family transcriptional regulator n=1 Tax=Tepidanaerobacter acetatoxydans TaxID=499229 RepID=UPI0026EC2F04|nr:TetR/AcrR family transcriptional regulator [Tepidanaerobacter acetatoxydans]NLU10296.1 TetR/AcrR family transcriptional regulator [Tepidanaerobacter acetatoxydans]